MEKDPRPTIRDWLDGIEKQSGQRDGRIQEQGVDEQSAG